MNLWFSRALPREVTRHPAGALGAFCPVGSLGAALDQRVQRRGDASRLMTRASWRAPNKKPCAANVGADG
jgi:hypothetical protein